MRFPFTGVIPVDKPVGVSSRRVVDVVARNLGMKSVGHAGTLDPLASGVVIVCVGHATKLVDYLHELPKHYSARFLLGRSSPSDDFETPIEEEPQPVRPSAEEIEAAAAGFRGDILQRPCDYSAVHVDGKRAYRLARKGRPVVLESKPVRIDRLEITGYEWPRLAVEIDCSSGTFALLPAGAAVGHLPSMVLRDDVLASAIRGGLVPLPEGSAPAVTALDDTGHLIGILKQLDAGSYRLRPNFLPEFLPGQP